MLKIDSSWIISNIQKFLNKNVVIISGAGISVNAGIPDFRSKTGIFSDIYKKYKIKGEDLFTYKFGLNESTRQIYINYIYNLKKLVDKAEPTFTHKFFKWYASKCANLRVYTQNIDGLEEKADFKDYLVYLHGNLKYLKCIRCGFLEEFVYEDTDDVSENKKSDNSESKCSNEISKRCDKKNNFKNENLQTSFGKCKKCKLSITRHKSIQTFLHPTIIHYYQDHPDSDYISKCIKEDSCADLLIVVGTSLNVFGVRNMVKYFYKMKCECLFVNLEECRSDMKKYFKYFYQGPSDDFFKMVKKLCSNSNITNISDSTFIKDCENLSFGDISILRDVIFEEKIEKRMKRLSLTKDEITNNFLRID